MQGRIVNLETEMQSVHALSSKVNEMDGSVKTLYESHEAMKQSISDRNNETEKKLSDMDKQIKELQEEFVYEKTRSMRNNLVFHGVEEQPFETSEQTEAILRDFIGRRMEVPIEHIELNRTHRLGPFKPGKNRSIVTNFLRFKDKETIRKAGYQLRDTNYGVSEQYPAEIVARRRQLVPVMKDEKKKNGPKSCRLIIDKLHTDTNTYTIENGKVKSTPKNRQQQPRGASTSQHDLNTTNPMNNNQPLNNNQHPPNLHQMYQPRAQQPRGPPVMQQPYIQQQYTPNPIFQHQSHQPQRMQMQPPTPMQQANYAMNA